MSKIAASFSSWGKTCWPSKFLLIPTVNFSKAPHLFLCLAGSRFFFEGAGAPSVLDFVPLLCKLFPFFISDFSPSTLLALFDVVAAAAAMARLAFLRRIPQALQSDCKTKLKFQHIIFFFFEIDCLIQGILVALLV